MTGFWSRSYTYLPLRQHDYSEALHQQDEKYAAITTTFWSAPLRHKLSVGCNGLRSLWRVLGTPRARKGFCSTKARALLLLIRWILLAFSLMLLTSIAEALFFPLYTNPPQPYQAMADRVRASNETGRGNVHNEKVFIAANIINEDLIRGHWGQSLTKLVELLGPDNVFVSIYENDSGPEVASALRGLSDILPCNTSIVSNEHLSLDTFPTVILPTGEQRVKRITYLTEIRNKLLRPLQHPDSRKVGESLVYTDTRFDKVLFINDVYFDPVEALNLLFSTNYNPTTGKAEYGAVCAVDFINKAMMYDSFVVRDNEGYEIGLMFFPWFTSKGRGESRSDVLAGKDAVRVLSCWGGMAAYDATPFLRKEVIDPSSAKNQSTEQEATAIAMRGEETTSAAPLRFRHQSELYWEAAECCLINADFAVHPEVHDSSIFLNPYVRVAYDERTWAWLPFLRRYERGFRLVQYFFSLAFYPETNPRRTDGVSGWSDQRRWLFNDDSLNGEKMRPADMALPEDTSGRWEVTREPVTPGGFCGQRRLFVMKKDLEQANRDGSGRNWENIPIPSTPRRRS